MKLSKNDKNPMVHYLIVHKSLGMSAGKLAAQCSHATKMCMLEYNRLLTENGNSYCYNYNTWIHNGMRTIVLQANDKDWAKLKKLPIELFIVHDAGLTEIAAGSETVISTVPMRKDDAPKLLKRLRVLAEPEQVKLWLLCEKFIHDHCIYGAESIYQMDDISLDSLEFIEKICDIVGYHVHSEDDN